MAGSRTSVDDRGNRVTCEQAALEIYPTAAELAHAFGSTILEPSWWPADAGEISYWAVPFSSGRTHYEIESTRRDGVPVGVIGHLDVSAGRSPREWLDGEWTEPRELAHLRGLIGRVGTPPALQGVIYDQGLEIHLIGYDTDDEILSAVTSLRRVRPD
jgi:hypothetical protein